MNKEVVISAAAALLLGAAFHAAAQEPLADLLKAGQEQLKTNDFSGAGQAAEAAFKVATNTAGKCAALQLAGQAAERAKTYDKAQEAYARILGLAELPAQDRIAALFSSARSYAAAQLFGKARDIYAKIAADQDATLKHKIDALNAAAGAWIAEKKYAEAREDYAKILALKDLPADARFKTQAGIAASCRGEGNVAGMKTAVAGLLQLEGPVSLKADRLSELGKLALDKREFVQARDAYAQLTTLPGLDVKRRYDACRNLAIAQRQAGSGKEEITKTAVQLGQVLEEMAGAEKIAAKEKLTLRLQAAGACGLGGDVALINKKIDEALAKAKELDAAARIEAFQDAALFYMLSRDYEVVRVLKGRGDALLERARVRNSYRCRFISAAPVGVGGWAQSEFVKDPRNKESRFHKYGGEEDEMLAADVAAERPLAEKDQAALAGRETAFFMAYDIKGWHMYIQSDEPEIEQIMAGAKRGSSLEMFFAPGLEGVPYYQWILKLATGDVNFYHWNTPHRFYRYLEHKVGSFQVETVALEKGWGTAIFIPWECLYDKLPFLEENSDTWRFSIMRWGPASVTWGGKVHETGRWGLVHWQKPTAEQLLAIEKNIVKRAWWKYQAAKAAASDFWQGSRGDPDFYREVLEPVIKGLDAFGEQIEAVDTWNAKTVNEVFRKNVPEWMEFNYQVEELRAAYLAKQMVAQK